MNITLTETEYCKLHIQYEAAPEEIATKKDDVIATFKDRPIPGFRKGKKGNVPLDAIKMHFRKQIDEQLTQQMAQKAVEDTVFEKKIKPFGYPMFSKVELKDDNFNCEFSLNKQPDFELGTYKEFEIPKPPVALTSEELCQQMIQELRDKNGDMTPYTENDIVQGKDTVVVDYSCFTVPENVPVPKLTALGEVVAIDKINVPGFSENLFGMKIGDEREFILNVPESFGAEFGGNQLKFNVKLTMGSKINPAPLNDELATKVNLKTIDELIGMAKSTADTRIKELENTQINDQISNRLLENHNFIVPEWIALSEAQMQASTSKIDWNALSEAEKKIAIEGAEKSVRLSLILGRIRDEEPQSQLSEEEVFNIAKENISKYSPDPQKVFEELYANGHLQILFSRIRDIKTLEFIHSTCKIVE
jgi:trigger factor